MNVLERGALAALGLGWVPGADPMSPGPTAPVAVGPCDCGAEGGRP